MYDVHRSNQCPTGEHVVINDATGQPETKDCTCPALVVRASGPPGPVEPHLMQWSRAELATLVREMDRGYFDANGAPPRRLSMFVSAFQTELLDLLERAPFAAVVRLLTRCVFHRVAFCFATYQLSFELMPGHWAVIQLPDEQGGQITYRSATEAGGSFSQVLWERPLTAGEEASTEEDIRAQVRELLHGENGWSPADTSTTILYGEEEKLLAATLDDLAAAAAQLQEEADGDPSALRRAEVLHVARPTAPAGVLPVEPAAPGRKRRRGGTPKLGAGKKRLPPKADK